MKKVMGFLACSVLFLSGCAINLAKSKELETDDGILFISDPANQENEVSYYDALLELKEQYPNELRTMKILSDEEQSALPVKPSPKGTPALIIINNGKVIMHVSGIQPKEKIIYSFEQAIVQLKSFSHEKTPEPR